MFKEIICKFHASLPLTWIFALSQLECSLKALSIYHYLNTKIQVYSIFISFFFVVTNIPRSWSWTGWPLRIIHFSNGNIYFPFYVDFFPFSIRECRGLGCMVIGSTTTYAIGAYHHTTNVVSSNPTHGEMYSI